jgi:Caspase domain
MLCRWLVGDAQDDDSLFFHYSGHGGSQKGNCSTHYTDSTSILSCHSVSVNLMSARVTQGAAQRGRAQQCAAASLLCICIFAAIITMLKEFCI